MPVLRRVSTEIFGEEGDILADSTTQSLIAASSILVTGSMLISPLIADLATVFGVSEASAGWLITSYTGAAAVMLPIVGALSDRVGRKPVMVTGLLLFGLSGAVIGLVSRFEVALALRVLQGIGFAAAYAVILTLFGDLYSGARETTVQGMRVSGNSAANTLGPLLAGFLFVSSWRYPFAVYLLAIPSALWIQTAIPRFEATNDWSVRRYVRKTSSFLTNIQIILLMVSFMFRFVVFYGSITYISVLAIREAGLAVVAVGTLLSARGLVKTLSSTQAGRLSLSHSPAFLSFISFCIVAAGITLMGVSPSPTVLGFGALLWGIGDGILSPCQKSLVNRLSPPEYRGGVMSTALTSQNIGKFAGPVGVAILLNAVDPKTAFVVLGVVGGGIGVVAMLFVWLWDS